MSQQHEHEDLASRPALTLFDDELPDPQEHLRVYRKGVRELLRLCVPLAQIADCLRGMKRYAASHGWALPLDLRAVEALDLSHPQSPLCRLLQQAYAAGMLSGKEPWLQSANWKEGVPSAS